MIKSVAHTWPMKLEVGWYRVWVAAKIFSTAINVISKGTVHAPNKNIGLMNTCDITDSTINIHVIIQD